MSAAIFGSRRLRLGPRSLRGKSLLAVLVPLTATLAVGGVVGLVAVDRVAERVVVRRDSELARVAAARLSERLLTQAALLEESAAQPVVTRGLDGDTQAVEEALSSLRSGDLSSFDMGLLLFDAEGAVLVSDPPWLARLPQWAAYPDRSQLRAVLGLRQPAFSSVFRDPINGLRFVLVATPVLDGDRNVRGVVAGAMTLNGVVLRDTADIRAGSSGSAYLVDDRGSVIFHEDPDLVGRPLDGLAAVARALRGGTGAVVDTGSAGARTISGFSPVEGTGWALITEESWTDVVAPIRRTGQLLLGVTAVAGLAALAGLYVLTSRMVSPIGRLVEGADRIAAGDLEFRVDTNTDEELRLLGERFNAMAASLQSSYATLEARVDERTAENRRLYEEAAERAEELAELNRRAAAVATVAKRVGGLASLDALLPAVGDLLRATFDYSETAVYLLDDLTGELTVAGDDGSERRPPLEGGLAGRAAVEGTTRAEGGDALAVPIRSGELVVGVLEIHAAQGTPLTEADRFTAETFADQLAVAIENARLFTQAGELAVLEERNRFAREIHDTLAQHLTAIVLQLEALEHSLEARPAVALEHLTLARDLTRDALQEARRSVWNLLPARLASNSLDEVLRAEVARFASTGPEAGELVVLGRPRALRRDVQTALVRIAQEALTNARKHADASRVEVQIAYLPGTVQLRVTDNGRGINAVAQQGEDGGGFGLGSMRTRARQLFGTVEVRTGESSAGTIVEATIPAD